MQTKIVMDFRSTTSVAVARLPGDLKFLEKKIKARDAQESFCAVTVQNDQLNEILKWAEKERIQNGRKLVSSIVIFEQYDLSDCKGKFLEFSAHHSQSDNVEVLNTTDAYRLSFNCKECTYYEYIQDHSLSVALDDQTESDRDIGSLNDILFADNNEILVSDRARSVMKLHKAEFRKVIGAKGYSQLEINGRLPLNIKESPLAISEICSKCGARADIERKRIVRGPELPHDNNEKDMTLIREGAMLTIMNASPSYPVCVDQLFETNKLARKIPNNVRRLGRRCFFFMTTALAKDLFSAGITGISVRPVIQLPE